MKDILINVNSKTSRIDLKTARLGINGENLQGNLIVKFDDEFVNGTAILEIQRGNEKGYLTMEKQDNSYVLPIKSSLLSKTCTINLQIRITTEAEEDTPIWKSNIFYLKVEEAINSDKAIPDEYPEWIDIANSKLNEIDNVDIDITTVDDNTKVVITRKDGTKKEATVSGGSGNVSSVNGKTGEVVLNAEDVGALPKDTTIPTKLSQLKNDNYTIIDSEYVHTDNNYTNFDKEKLEELENYDDTEIKKEISAKQDKLIAGDNIVIEGNKISSTGGGTGGTSDYNDLTNKPSINDVELTGNKKLSDLGIQPKGNYLTEHQDISGKEDKSNKITSITSENTNEEYPSAKAVYDLFASITDGDEVSY
jgi:hypothetical protein